MNIEQCSAGPIVTTETNMNVSCWSFLGGWEEARQGSRSICPSFSRSAVEAEVDVSDRSNKVPVGSGRGSFASAWKQATLLSMVDQSLIIYRRITPCRSAMQSSNGTSLPCGPDRNQIRQGDYMMPVQYVCSDEGCYRSWLPSTLIFSHFRQWIGSKIT